MKRRMHLKKRRKNKKSIINKITLLIILLIISVIYLLNLFNKKAIPMFISYSEIETKKIISLIINNTITEEIANNVAMEDLFITRTDSDGNITSIDFDSSEVNKILVDASRSVRNNLKYLEYGQIDKINSYDTTLYGYDIDKLNQGIVYELPSGVIFNNALLNNILPKIPIKISPIGNVICVLNTDIKSYGINNAMIIVKINIEAEVKILLPFTSSTVKIDTDVPIIMKLIEGNVPSYYMNGYMQSPMVTNNIDE